MTSAGVAYEFSWTLPTIGSWTALELEEEEDRGREAK